MEHRVKAVYDTERGLPLRKSHLNPAVKRLYDEYLGQPGGHLSHELLHTHYTDRSDLLK